MKVSRRWLQTYFDQTLPSVEELALRLTFRAFEIEESTDDMLDIKVLPDRASYALSHRGIARELSAILGIPLKRDPLKDPLPTFPETQELSFTADPIYVTRHTGALVRGIKVGPSPEWLKNALEAVGQRSINNVVDAMNYVMFDMGQPSGAFDVGMMRKDGNTVRIDVRRARAGEKITILTGEEFTLSEQMFVFTDAFGGELLDIAGIKGGKSSGVTDKTTEIFITVGNYDPTLLRRASQSLKIFTDASQRFQNRPSPALTMYGMRDILKLVSDVAGGELVGVHDVTNETHEKKPVHTTSKRISMLIGKEISDDDVSSALTRLGLLHTREGDVFTVISPVERNDIEIPEDIAEEVGRITGYENLEPIEFPDKANEPDQHRFRGIERIKDFLVERGFTELSTQSFAKKGDIRLSNPLDVDNPYLRSSIEPNLDVAMKQAKYHSPLVLEPNEKIKLFELGTVFTKEGEKLYLTLSEPVSELTQFGLSGVTREEDLSRADLEALGRGYEPQRYELGAFTPFSQFPFVLRDVAVWVADNTQSVEVHDAIVKSAGELLFKCQLFDTFTKEGRTSYAFRLVFQSPERTLSDDEVNGMMTSVTDALTASSWQVR